ncbi:hypothetical protein [Enterococcus italicus]|uniref:Uncharacterized protein n=1 Tax=Enterococcus italicus (strain DSM 15952 / CCUG 50447 / LMG 22039 / TP 1.5) TaxID=888064 RepID=E6LEN1_ENTI1|nr:hypothetical protein [Enterococcus italicus]EFU74344.1 hypothetical protein HMPREF9088_0821 [Enterococcus italicus DSM 15952]OJG56789.1 hypothetical protein RT43_GL001426 [Enterococcus italicus DSM 15952]
MKRKEFSFMFNKQYQAIIKEAQKEMKQIKQLIDYDSKEERLNQAISDSKKNTVNAIQDFVKSQKQAIKDQQTAIEQSYAKARNTYKNPTEELLRRQDFDMEVGSMDQSEIATLVHTPGRTFTTYELNKLYSLDVDSTTKSLLKAAINKNKHPYREEEKYQYLQKEAAELELISNESIQRAILYLPSESAIGFETISVNTLFSFKDNYEYEQKNQTIENALAIVPTNETTQVYSRQSSSLSELAGIREKPERVYEDFDPRIFKSSSNYDITDRFKYLKERFNENDTDRFDVTKENYSIYDHLDYLEGQHAKKLKTDTNYREAYQKAEKAANNADNVQVEE